jgi:zinc finger MYND domain-containing protein 10
MTREQELDKNSADIEFSVSMICFSLIRFISDHIRDLSVPIVHQMMENNDIPCALVPLLEIKPWIRKNTKGETEKYED